MTFVYFTLVALAVLFALDLLRAHRVIERCREEFRRD